MIILQLDEENQRLWCALYDIAAAYGVEHDSGNLDVENLCEIVKKNSPCGVLLRDNVWATVNSFVYDENLIKYVITSTQKKYRSFGVIRNDSDDDGGFFVYTEDAMRKCFYGKKENVPISKKHLHKYGQFMDEKTFVNYIDALKERGLL